jgi:hypothetical protein
MDGSRVSWKRFLGLLLRTAGGLILGLYAAVLIIDPYNTVWFSPPFSRAPMATNQRFSFPALARSDRFDSAIIGTSTTRLLEPTLFNHLLGGAFVNLSMNSGTAYEQSRILDLFTRHHQRVKTVILGIDVAWCETGETYQKFTQRPFPPWMYDDNRWNDLLYLFNFPTLEETGKEFAYMTGIRPLKYGLDGYTNFLPDRAVYSIEKARKNLYGNGAPRRKAPADPPVMIGNAERTRLNFPTHELMRDMLAALPAATRKVLLFVPYHHFHQPQPRSEADTRWRECKRRLTRLAGGFENTHVLDLMIPSEITLKDENYWDPLHYNTEVAAQIAELVAHGIREKTGSPGLFKYLLAAPTHQIHKARRQDGTDSISSDNALDPRVRTHKQD